MGLKPQTFTSLFEGRPVSDPSGSLLPAPASGHSLKSNALPAICGGPLRRQAAMPAPKTIP
jgi:hypothetical protein